MHTQLDILPWALSYTRVDLTDTYVWLPCSLLANRIFLHQFQAGTIEQEQALLIANSLGLKYRFCQSSAQAVPKGVLLFCKGLHSGLYTLEDLYTGRCYICHKTITNFDPGHYCSLKPLTHKPVTHKFRSVTLLGLYNHIPCDLKNALFLLLCHTFSSA